MRRLRQQTLPSVEVLLYLVTGHDFFQAVDPAQSEQLWQVWRAALVPYMKSHAPDYMLYGEWKWDLRESVPWRWGLWDYTHGTQLDVCRRFLAAHAR